LYSYIYIYIYVCVCSLAVIYDKLPYMLYTSIKFVTPWRWSKYLAETCGRIYNKYKPCATTVKFCIPCIFV